MNSIAPHRFARSVFYGILLVLSVGVAAYALSLALLPELRLRLSPLAVQLIRGWPGIALIHFAGGGIALAVGIFQFLEWLRVRQPVIHRYLGRIYVLSVLLGGSAGFVMATRSGGGVVAQVGFGTLAVLWVWTTVQAYRAIRVRQVLLHRAWMLRSFSLTLAAVTLRIYLPLSQLTGWPFEVSYAVIAWLCWLPNLLIAMRLAPLRLLQAREATRS